MQATTGQRPAGKRRAAQGAATPGPAAPLPSPAPATSGLGLGPRALQEPSSLEKRVVGAVVKAVFFRGRRGGPWEPPLGLDVSEVRFRGNSGARLHGWYARHPAPRGIVVLAHPDRRYGKQWFAREGWLSWLHANGFASVCFDFPVYGRSGGGSTYLHDDVAAACRLARDLQPGLPVHLVGLSIGAFAAANAAPTLDFVESLVLESPYPTFEAWYSGAGESAGGRPGRPAGHGAANSLLGRLFPRTYRRIDAGANVAHARARRILVAGTRADEVTPIALTRAMAGRAPPGRTRYLELADARHLGLFGHADYRAAVLATLAPPAAEPVAAVRGHSVPAR